MTQTTNWHPYAFFRPKPVYHPCVVCERPGEAYLPNSFYCDYHFDLAMRRDQAVAQVMGDPVLADEALRNQPDIWDHKKYLRLAEGMEYP